jgi:sigma-70-like protein
VLSVEDWAEIRRLRRAEGMPIKVIARVMGCSKNTVKSALASEGPLRYERVSRGSGVDEAEPRIRELLATWPSMPATVIAERIGWEGTVALTEGKQTRPRLTPRSDSEGEFGEGRRESMPWINIKAEFVVATAEVLNEGVSGADHSC